MRKIDQDTFESWLAHPATELFLVHCKRQAEVAQAQWLNVSWHGGSADDKTLQRLRGRAEAYLELSSITLQDLEEDE